MRPLQTHLRSINTPLLDYDIAAAAGTEDRGARIPAEIGKEITRKLQEAFDFA